MYCQDLRLSVQVLLVGKWKVSNSHGYVKKYYLELVNIGHTHASNSLCREVNDRSCSLKLVSRDIQKVYILLVDSFSHRVTNTINVHNSIPRARTELEHKVANRLSLFIVKAIPEVPWQRHSMRPLGKATYKSVRTSMVLAY